MPLRIATPADLEPILSLIGQMHQEIGLGRVNDAMARVAALQIIEKGQCGVALREQKIVGSLGLELAPFKYFEGRVLKEEWFYVMPEHRHDKNANGENAGHAAQLIEWARAAGDKVNRPLVLFMATMSDPQTKLKWFRKRMVQFSGGFVHFPRAA